MSGTLPEVTLPAQQSAHVVMGRYAMGPALGRGATAVVHRARELSTGEDVAVKCVPAELGLGDRVRVEARAASRLDHPSIARLLDVGEDHECLYLVWELVEGPSLARVLAAAARPPDRMLVRLMGEVLSALAHAHDRGVVHRDVKPGNILIDERGYARLTDFGVARLVDEAGPTLTGSIVGTMSYMAPEQALGHPVGPEADVYSACLVLLEALTGTNPIAAPSPAETARRAAAAAVPPLGQMRPDLPEALCRLVDAGLRRDPRVRPTAADLADELGVVRGGVVSARRRWGRLLPTVAAGAAGAGLAAVAVTTSMPADRGGPAVTVAAMAVGAAVAAWRPRLAAALAVVVGAVLLGLDAPGLAVLLGAAALVLLAVGVPAGRAVLLPVAAPALFAIGLGPLYAVVAGLVPRWRERLWAICAGTVTALAWQLSAGAEGLLSAGGYVSPASADLEGEMSPVVAARRLWEPLAADPGALVQVPVFIVAAMCVPAVMRVHAGMPRILAAAGWAVALAVALAVACGDVATAVGSVIPTAIVVMVWAAWPRRAGAGTEPARASATLRSSVR